LFNAALDATGTDGIAVSQNSWLDSKKSARWVISGAVDVKMVTETDIASGNASGYNPDHCAGEEVVESENQD
jgi:hypothetical protein